MRDVVWVIVVVIFWVPACQQLYGIEGTKVADEGTCAPFSSRACFEGPPELAGVGGCAQGAQTCNSDGTAWEACLGEGAPKTETCRGLDENCDGYQVCSGDYKSVKASGGVIRKFVRDAGGNLYILGSYESAIVLGSDTLPAGDLGETFIAKLSPSHEVLWARAIVGLATQDPLDFTINKSGGVTVIGAYTTKPGEIFKIGSREMEASVSASEASFFIVRYDDGGAISWVSNLQAAGYGNGTHIIEDAAGELFIYHAPHNLHPLLFYQDPSFQATSINSDSSHVPFVIFRISPSGVYREKMVMSISQSYNAIEAADMAFDSAHALVIAGYNPNGPLGIFPPEFNVSIPSGPFLARLSVPPEQPQYRMLRAFALSATPAAITLDDADVVFSVGQGFARTIMTAGPVFQIPLTGVGGSGIAIDAAKNVVVTGGCFQATDFNAAAPGGQHTADADGDVCAAKYAPDGSLIWSKVMSSGGTQKGVSLQAGPLGDILIGGTARGPVDFGGGQADIDGTFLLTLFP